MSRSRTTRVQSASEADLPAPGGVAERLAVPPERLRRRCDPEQLAPRPLAGCEPNRMIGQRRAQEALVFGLAMDQRGFNIFVTGPPGTGRSTAVRALLEQAAAGRPVPPDWAYVHNFQEPSRPRALRLPAGVARRLRDGLRKLVLAARREIPRAFESEEYIAYRESVVSELQRRRAQGLSQLTTQAQGAGFLLQPMPTGLALVPVMAGRPISDEAYAGLPEELRGTIDRRRGEIEAEIRDFLKEMRAAERETRERLELQDREVALHAVGGLVEDLADDFPDEPGVAGYLAEVREGILADILLFRGHPLPSDAALPEPSTGGDPQHALHERAFRKYEVNVMVDNGDATGAPVVAESNPNHPNLVGRIEREAIFGALMTDFGLISSGALHRANGGYLMLRVEDVLRAPLAWEALKRSLREGSVVIEDLSEAIGLANTRGLRPDPIPLSLKVILLGEPTTYALLHALDPDFRELFKVRADFDSVIDWNAENQAEYAGFIAGCAERAGRPASREAIALIVEEAARMVADQQKLSARFGVIADLLSEVDHWAAIDAAPELGEQHVRRAQEERRYRTGLLRQRLREAVSRGVLLVRPGGSAIGEVHGLAVLAAGGEALGQPTRITATVGVGRDGVVDIERQAELGGKIHSKGVMILGGYLADTYAAERPLALVARLVFEQSYEEVEGDSASLAELLAILSRLAELPLRQDLAVTGSVNQRGEVQAVGGVNEKVEGFFETCQAVGPSGEPGVLLPASNVQHLMLREDVVEAASRGQFRVYAVRSVNEALELMTGRVAGERQADGTFPPESVHGLVDRRLRQLADALQETYDRADEGRAGTGGRRRRTDAGERG